MQKKLIALAIAAAFSAPAFADTSVYGTLDVGYANAGKTINTPTTSVKTSEAAFAYSTMASSKLGVQTTEDAGDGMKLAVKIETGISSNQMAGFTQTALSAQPANNGTTIDATTLGSRELWVALMLSSGTTIKAGYGSTLIRDISLGYAADPGGNLVGNVLNNDKLLGSNRVVGATLTQSFGAITGIVQLSTNTDTSDNKTDTKNGNGYLLGLQYAEGPISASFAYQNLKTVDAITGTGTTIAPVTPATSDTAQKITILAGSYDLQMVKLFAEYANIKADDNLTATKATKKTYESIGVDVPFTSALLGFVQMSHGTYDTTASATGASQSVSGYTLGAKYSLNKTTYGYASIGENKVNQTGATTGAKVDQYTVGLVKNF